MAITVLIEFDIKASFYSQFQHILSNNLAETQKYDGCLDVQMYSQVEGESIMVLLQWVSISSHRDYLEWRFKQPNTGQELSMLKSKPTIRYFKQSTITSIKPDEDS